MLTYAAFSDLGMEDLGEEGNILGTQFTCFTGTEVQILALRAASTF
jgi:hypothetical protein